jgi:hypothetical protein
MLLSRSHNKILNAIKYIYIYVTMLKRKLNITNQRIPTTTVLFNLILTGLDVFGGHQNFKLILKKSNFTRSRVLKLKTDGDGKNRSKFLQKRTLCSTNMSTIPIR